MTDSTPVLTLAIPILGSESERDLRTTLDAAIQLWADSPGHIRILIQSSQPVPDGFLQDLPADRFDIEAEPDTGIYDAMNRLLDRCPTARILFMGAGDRPLAGLRIATERWTQQAVDDTLQLGGVQLPDAEPGVPEHYPARWDRSLYWRNTAHHQGIAYPTPLLRRVGGFSTEYRILADYARNLSLFLDGASAHWVPGEDWVSVLPGGVSRQFDAALYAEEQALKQALLPPGWARWCQPLWIRAKAWRKNRAQRTA